MATIIPKGSFYGFDKKYMKFDSGATLTAGDLVSLSSGELILATGSTPILGIVQEDATSSSTGVTVDVTPYQVVIMDNDNTGTTFAATHVGTLFDITGTTGAQVVDTSSTGSGDQLTCIEYNPQDEGLDSDVSIGKFVIVNQLFM